MKRNIYRGNALKNISFPIGGIGTGCIGLAGNGSLIDWEIFNRPNKGSLNGYSHFAVKTECDGQVIDTRVLNGDRTWDLCGQLERGFGHGLSNMTMAGFPHFRECEFCGEYPVATIVFGDADFPGEAELSAFNPFIPLNSDDSSLPVAMFSIRLKNTTEQSLDYTVAGVLANPREGSRNRAVTDDGTSAVFLDSADNKAETTEWCDMTIATDGVSSVCVQPYWYRGMWYDNIETYWNEMCTPGFPTVRDYDAPGERDHSTLFVRKRVEPGEVGEFRFVISWNCPWFENFWWPAKNPDGTENRTKMINYYSTRFENSLESARYAVENWDRLWSETDRYRKAIFQSSLPDEVKDAVASTASVLKSPTCLRIGEKGDFWGWEGLNEHVGSCEGTCTHVWSYVYSTCFLFPDIERNIRENDYKYNQFPTGEMRFRTKLPFGSAPGTNRACLDGTMCGVIKTYREWKLSGDDNWLRSLWDSVKLSLEYAWSPENGDMWDRDRDGIAEGRQHHTLDMELFGPSSWLEGLYLCALKAAQLMAEHLGDSSAAEYERLFLNGKKWMKDNLFNGEYFIQKIDLDDKGILEKYCTDTVDIFGNEAVSSYWNEETGEIKYQIGDGCEIDQLLAQWHADILGLGEIFDESQTRKALDSMYRYNFKRDMRRVANPFRIYALNDESGTVMCDYPEGARKPKIPIVTASETMHGFEYEFAALLISHGSVERGLEIVRSVRDRYNGENRNPWNELECGSNYARNMACWALIPILSGMTFDSVLCHLGFAPRIEEDEFVIPWFSGNAWGIYRQEQGSAHLTVISGELRLNTFSSPVSGELYIDGEKAECKYLNDTYTLEKKHTVKNELVIK